MKRAVAAVCATPEHVQSPSKLDADAAAGAMPDDLLAGVATAFGVLQDNLTLHTTWEVALAAGGALGTASVTQTMVALALTMPGLYGVVRRMLDVAASSGMASAVEALRGGVIGTVTTDVCTAPVRPATTATPRDGTPLPASTSNPFWQARYGEQAGSCDNADVASSRSGSAVSAGASDATRSVGSSDGEGDASESDIEYTSAELKAFARAGRGFPRRAGSMTAHERDEAECTVRAMVARRNPDDAIYTDFPGSIVYISSSDNNDKHITTAHHGTLGRQLTPYPACSGTVRSRSWCKVCVDLFAADCTEIDTEVAHIVTECMRMTATWPLLWLRH